MDPLRFIWRRVSVNPVFDVFQVFGREKTAVAGFRGQNLAVKTQLLWFFRVKGGIVAKPGNTGKMSVFAVFQTILEKALRLLT